MPILENLAFFFERGVYCNVLCILPTINECLSQRRFHASWTYLLVRLWSGLQRCGKKRASLPTPANGLLCCSPEGREARECLLTITRTSDRIRPWVCNDCGTGNKRNNMALKVATSSPSILINFTVWLNHLLHSWSPHQENEGPSWPLTCLLIWIYFAFISL